MEERWIIVRGRQAELVAEAEAERLARQARTAEADRRTVDSALAVITPRRRAPEAAGLVPIGATVAADAKFSRADCCEA